MTDDEPTLVIPRVSRRERRAEQRPRRLEALVGWFGYGLSVLIVMAMAAWLAVSGGAVADPPGRRDTVTKATVETRGVEPVSSSLPEPSAPAPAVPVSVLATTSTAPSTTTTTAPIVAAAATPTP